MPLDLGQIDKTSEDVFAKLVAFLPADDFPSIENKLGVIDALLSVAVAIFTSQEDGSMAMPGDARATLMEQRIEALKAALMNGPADQSESN